MNCKTIHNKLIFFIEEELSTHEMRAVESHLKNCSSCALFADELQKTLGLIEKEKVYEQNPFFYTRVKARLEKQHKKIHMTRPVLIRVMQPLAFSILLVLGVYGGIQLGVPHKTNQMANTQQIVPYLNEIETEPIEAFLME
jgi:hypothetical protein